MGLHEDIALVNEANAFAHDSKQWPWFPSKKLAEYVRQLANAFYRLRDVKIRDDDAEARSGQIEIEQRLAHILVRHCEDKKNPPYIHADGAYDIGLKSLRILAVEVSERIDQIVRFRDVLARNILEQREEYEKKLGDLRAYVAELEKNRGEIRDELNEAKEMIRVKDAALLVAAERIKGQSEALTDAARKKPWRRACESIHPPYSGKCEHCLPPDPGELAREAAESQS